MLQTKTTQPAQNTTLSYYVKLALLIVLIDKTDLKKQVRTHCKTGLTIIGIIYAEHTYNTITDALLATEFDAFFNTLPAHYMSHRHATPVDLIIKNIQLSIAANDMVYTDNE